MFEKNTSENLPTWPEIIEAIKTKALEDCRARVVPVVKTGRSTLGNLLVALGQKLQQRTK